jgi:hypothetical protein
MLWVQDEEVEALAGQELRRRAAGQQAEEGPPADLAILHPLLERRAMGLGRRWRLRLRGGEAGDDGQEED